MSWFRRIDDEERAARDAAASAQEESLAALTSGGLPFNAARRVGELAANGDFFTSDLSVNEFALLHQLGIRPLGQVMGSSIYHVGWQQNPGTWAYGGSSQELTVLSEAWNAARERAFARLEQEASLLGADAVVGVKLTVGRHDWASGAIEYVAVGTGVKVEGGTREERVVLTDLSGQEYWQLLRAGHEPLGVVGASTVYYIVSGWRQQQAQSGFYSSWANQELTDFTQGVYDARETALGRITNEARRDGAAGVVGVSINHSVEEREVDRGGSRRTDLLVTLHVLGTTVAATEAKSGTNARPRLAINLSNNPDQVHILGGNR